jgi:hypothetical protein
MWSTKVEPTQDLSWTLKFGTMIVMKLVITEVAAGLKLMFSKLDSEVCLLNF